MSTTEAHKRATSALDAIYAGGPYDGVEIQDLITDLLHLTGDPEDAWAVLSSSFAHYAAERQPDTDDGDVVFETVRNATASLPLEIK